MQFFFNFQYRHAEVADNFTGGVHDKLSTQRVENVSLGLRRKCKAAVINVQSEIAVVRERFL